MKQSRLIKKHWQRGQHLTQSKYEYNNRSQKRGAPLALNLMSKLADMQDKELPVEFFFYTNTLEKAKALADEMVRLQYEVYGYGPCGYDTSQFSIAGCTPKMKMTDEVMTARVEKMCELGYQYDCKFDGWGTLLDFE